MFLINLLLRSLSFTIYKKRCNRNVVFLLSGMLTLMLLNSRATFRIYETILFGIPCLIGLSRFRQGIVVNFWCVPDDDAGMETLELRFLDWSRRDVMNFA